LAGRMSIFPLGMQVPAIPGCPRSPDRRALQAKRGTQLTDQLRSHRTPRRLPFTPENSQE
jgi:hypothetical protein